MGLKYILRRIYSIVTDKIGLNTTKQSLEGAHEHEPIRARDLRFQIPPTTADTPAVVHLVSLQRYLQQEKVRKFRKV